MIWNLQKVEQGLSVLDNLFGKSLPVGMEWFYYLDILDAIRVSTVSLLKKYEGNIQARIYGCFVGEIRKS